MNILNVNDVTITGFEGTTQLTTVGGDSVTLVGTNFGPVDQAVPATFTATYGPTGTSYNATECVRVPGAGNTRLRCVSSPGGGAGLKWRVTVTSAGIGGDSVLSDVTTAYLPPTITGLSPNAASLLTSVSGHVGGGQGCMRGQWSSVCGCGAGEGRGWGQRMLPLIPSWVL